MSPLPMVSSVEKRWALVPVMMITSPVREQMTMVSMRGSRRATTPSETGSGVLAAAWAMGAEPCPASLEKSPRRTPHMRVTTKTPAPTPATPAWGSKASTTMREKAAGSSPRFMAMMMRAPRT